LRRLAATLVRFRGSSAEEALDPPRARASQLLVGPSTRSPKAEVLGGHVVLEESPCMIKLSNSWLIVNPGGGATPDKLDISLVNYEPGNAVSSFLNLRVADIQACYEQWSSKGAEFVTPPIDRGAEIRCYMRAPDGYMIEVGQSTGLLVGDLARSAPKIYPVSGRWPPAHDQDDTYPAGRGPGRDREDGHEHVVRDEPWSRQKALHRVEPLLGLIDVGHVSGVLDDRGPGVGDCGSCPFGCRDGKDHVPCAVEQQDRDVERSQVALWVLKASGGERAGEMARDPFAGKGHVVQTLRIVRQLLVAPDVEGGLGSAV
jgi:hypothetical protein